MAEKITLQIDGVGNADKFLSNIEKSLNTLSSQADKTSKSVGSAGDVFKGAFAAQLAIKGLEALTAAASKLFDVFVTQGIKAASEQESAIVALNQSLASSGKLLPGVSKEFQDFASQLQSQSKFGDEVVLQNAALIQSLGNLEKDGLKQATQASLDLATALGVDLRTASVLVGKAAAGNVDSFSRYGITIEKAATQSETFQRVLDKINERFGGSAQAALQTFSGSLTAVENAFSDLQEESGSLITQNPVILAGLNALKEIFEALSTNVKNNQQAYINIINAGIIPFVHAMGVAIEVTRLLVIAGESILLPFKNVFTLITNASAAAALAISGDFKSAGLAIDQGLQTINQRTEELGRTPAFDKLNEGFAEISINMQNAATQSAVTAGAIVQNAQFTREQLLEQERLKNQQIAEERAAADILEIERVTAQNEALRTIDITKNDEQIRANEALIDSKITALETEVNLTQATSDKILQIRAAQIAKERQLDQQRLQAAGTFFGGFAALARTGGEKTFGLFKGLATSQAIVQGIAAVQNALASVPFPFNIAAAAGMAALTTANVIEIQRTQLAEGTSFLNGPGTGTSDSIPASLSRGERVISARGNADLTEFLAAERERREDSGGSMMDAILALASRPVVVSIDGKEVFNVVDDQLSQGRAFAT